MKEVSTSQIYEGTVIGHMRPYKVTEYLNENRTLTKRGDIARKGTYIVCMIKLFRLECKPCPEKYN